jgi:hypothetical protein
MQQNYSFLKISIQADYELAKTLKETQVFN